MREESKTDMEVVALGFAWSVACDLLDKGEDPRKFEIPRLLASWDKRKREEEKKGKREMPAKESQYIGDSVYAAEDSGILKLFTWNGYTDDPRNVIYLEEEVWNNLKRFVMTHLEKGGGGK